MCIYAGIFMALQDKLISCGPTLSVFGLVLKFIAGPAAMAISAIAVGLHGDVLRVAIIQVTSFNSSNMHICFHSHTQKFHIKKILVTLFN